MHLHAHKGHLGLSQARLLIPTHSRGGGRRARSPDLSVRTAFETGLIPRPIHPPWRKAEVLSPTPLGAHRFQGGSGAPVRFAFRGTGDWTRTSTGLSPHRILNPACLPRFHHTCIVRVKGLAPPRPEGHWILSPARLLIPPHPRAPALYELLRALGWITGQTGAPAARLKATMTGIGCGRSKTWFFRTSIPGGTPSEDLKRRGEKVNLLLELLFFRYPRLALLPGLRL